MHGKEKVVRNRYSIVVRDGGTTIVSINRPASMNSLNPAANSELAQVFDEFENDCSQRVAILTGTGTKAFSAGLDLNDIAAHGKVPTAPMGFAGITSRYEMKKPVIAAVNGAALGGGFEAALACDVILASENAVFALPEPRFGLAALAGGLHRLPRSLGLHRAMSIILTGRQVSAGEALTLGFVIEVVSPDQLLETALKWAAEMIECSPLALCASKELVLRGLGQPINELDKRAWQHPSVLAMLNSRDAREGPRAFAEKRRPHWTGE